MDEEVEANMANLERDQSGKISSPEQTLINGKIEEIDPSCCCYFCEHLMQAVHTQYQQEYIEKGKKMVICCEVPGYKCVNCDIESFELQSSILVLESALVVIETSGDQATAKFVKASLDVGYAHVARFRQSVE